MRSSAARRYLNKHNRIGYTIHGGQRLQLTINLDNLEVSVCHSIYIIRARVRRHTHESSSSSSSSRSLFVRSLLHYYTVYWWWFSPGSFRFFFTLPDPSPRTPFGTIRSPRVTKSVGSNFPPLDRSTRALYYHYIRDNIICYDIITTL